MFKLINLANPFSWLILLFILVFLVLVALINTSDAIAPFLSLLSTTLTTEDIHSQLLFPVMALVRLSISGILLYFIFVIHSMMLGVLSYGASNFAARDLFDKKYDISEVVSRVRDWNRFRIRYITFPLLAVIVVSLVLFLLLMVTFNVFLIITGISLGFSTFISTLTVSVLAVAFVISLLLLFWRTITTIFGAEIVANEPELTNETAKSRSRKLALIKPKNIGLLVLYLFFGIIITIQVLAGIFIENAISIENFSNILIIILVDIVLFIGLGYLKANFYIDSLLYKYNKIINIGKNLTYEEL